MTLLLKHGKAKCVWIPGIALAWDLTTTMTASWQKVFSGNPKIGYFEQRVDLPGGPATTARCSRRRPTLDQMQQIVTNSTVNGVLQALFALLTLVVRGQRVPVIWVRAWQPGGLPTTEVPHVESHVVAPVGLLRHRGGEGSRAGVGGLAAASVAGQLAMTGVVRRAASGLWWYLSRSPVSPLGRLPRPLRAGRHRPGVAACLRAAPCRAPGALGVLALLLRSAYASSDPEPPPFAQGVGLAFALVALVAFVSGLTTLGYVATGFALVAALLNATIGLCLGCEAYLLGRRLLAAANSPKIPATESRSTT